MRRFVMWIVAVVVVIAIALFFMPLKLAVSMAGLEDSKFSAREISGSIWSGRIEGAQLGPFALGDLNAGVQLLPLLAGHIKLDLERPASAVDSGLVATIGKSGESLRVEDATTTLSIGQQLAPLPASNIELDRVSITFANGSCQSATGQVRLSLDANIPGLGLKQGLLGTATCRDGILILPLASGSGMERLTLKLEGSGSYSARLFLSGSNRIWALLLPTLGFRQVPNGYAIRTTGQLNK